MVVRRDDDRHGEDQSGEPPRSHLTTVVLEERADGSWRATQHGVAVDGRGDTAAAAAAAYCSKVATRLE